MNYEFKSKPSKPTIIKCIKNALNSSDYNICVIWGENQIEILRTRNGLFGSGWIGKNSGDDIAKLFKMTT